jgi:hypothetical protein
MMDKEKFLFLDFDETLVSTLCPSTEKHADELLDTYTKIAEGVKFELLDGWYVSFLRPETKEFLTRCYLAYGMDNVGILSQGTCDYVSAAVRHLKLNMHPNNVYGREDLQQYVPRFKKKNLVLVDNEDWYYHVWSGKVKFMDTPAREKFIHVRPYDVRYSEEELDLDKLMNDIEWAFNYEEENNKTECI